MAQTLCIQFRDGQQTIDKVRGKGDRGEASPVFFSAITNGLGTVPIFNLYLGVDLEAKDIPTEGELFSVLIPISRKPNEHQVRRGNGLHGHALALGSGAAASRFR
jgi:hypothetical protein